VPTGPYALSLLSYRGPNQDLAQFVFVVFSTLVPEPNHEGSWTSNLE
jgi:hypothetical protein